LQFFAVEFPILALIQGGEGLGGILHLVFRDEAITVGVESLRERVLGRWFALAWPRAPGLGRGRGSRRKEERETVDFMMVVFWSFRFVLGSK
jgi:hypothetical protein